MNDFLIKYVLVRKYDLEGVKIDMYKYCSRDGLTMTYTDDILKAEQFDSAYPAEHALKFANGASGYFQIEKIYIKKEESKDGN